MTRVSLQGLRVTVVGTARIRVPRHGLCPQRTLAGAPEPGRVTGFWRRLARWLSPGNYLLGWGVTRRYGFSAVNPLGKRSVASSSDSAGTTITSWPSVQFTGVATL